MVTDADFTYGSEYKVKEGYAEVSPMDESTEFLMNGLMILNKEQMFRELARIKSIAWVFPITVEPNATVIPVHDFYGRTKLYKTNCYVAGSPIDKSSFIAMNQNEYQDAVEAHCLRRRISF